MGIENRALMLLNNKSTNLRLRSLMWNIICIKYLSFYLFIFCNIVAKCLEVNHNIRTDSIESSSETSETEPVR